jgi:pyruvate dehydrogenase E1 component
MGARYFAQRRASLGGHVPAPFSDVAPRDVPPPSAFATQLNDSGERGPSITMAFVRILTTWGLYLFREDASADPAR